MIDLHLHILPGVDDGSRDMDDSLAMADLAARSGVTTLVATPHSNQMGRFENFCSARLTEDFDELEAAVKRAGIPVRILRGMEIFASEDMGEKIRQGRLASICRSRYYLVEVPFGAAPSWIEARLQEIQARGATPLIAHVERYYCVQDDPMLVYNWLYAGCRIQVNKGSFFGSFGSAAHRTAKILMENDLISCVASDAHRPDVRTPWMKDVRDYLTSRAGEHYAHIVLTANPERIISDQPIMMHGRPPGKRKKFFWQ